mmetsp:Transcript_107949/g.304149  ORF Transcript_107949/g.304149 Transcript_107949/m.304149 type:complete len:271 (-) Transcript_107949:3-815(-)
MSMRSLTSPVSTAACKAAPNATTSSGFTDWFGQLPPPSSRASALTAGIRVEPPTSTTSPMSCGVSSASLMARATGALQRSSKSSQSNSKRFLVISTSRSLEPFSSLQMNGSETVACCMSESSTLAFSAASVSLCNACGLSKSLMPSFLSNSEASQPTIRRSKSSPPRRVSPFVARTSQTPLPTSKIETSKVPPPRSKTMIVSLFFLSSPYANEAAVGSFTIRSTSKPAMTPASFVARRCESLKYAGTVTTALVTLAFRYSAASLLSFLST